MPGVLASGKLQGKKKRTLDDAASEAQPKKPRISESSRTSVDDLEEAIRVSPRNLNKIAELLSIAKSDGKEARSATLSLCRVFSRLISEGRLAKDDHASENEITVREWLRERFVEYKNHLSDHVRNREPDAQILGVTLCMQLVQQELVNGKAFVDSTWRTGVFRNLIRALLHAEPQSVATKVFVSRFYQPYDDVRFYTFTSISEDLDQASDLNQNSYQTCLDILSSTPPLSANGSKPQTFFFKSSSREESKQKPSYTKASAHRKQAQRAWLALFSLPLGTEMRRAILQIMTESIVPWFIEPIRLMDFLTDCFNESGALALLALSGMFEMMTACNLDYPLFYNKLYSLLDERILHSSHRSRFFRLLNQFLASSHLPAALIASFIKKLARLALHAPPAAVVAVIPLAYNLLNEHRACTFMIHREMRTDEERQLVDLEGADDPFDPLELDPMETSAIDSCLWELVALQRHYHPNVAALANIISQPFTKPSYNLEDFLDHSYSTLVSAELKKDVKKSPVVEFEIPKEIFSAADGDATLVKLMQQMMESRRNDTHLDNV